jgi:SAM-dependent methyltransferase
MRRAPAVSPYERRAAKVSGLMNPAEFANIAHSERDFWWYRGMRAILMRTLDPYLAGRRVGRALEAGCGTGYFSRLLQTERRWPMIPLDISAAGLRYARRMGVARPVQGDVRSLPFGDACFDLVLSVDVLAHLPRPQEQDAAREMARVLAPGGLVAVRTAAFDFLRSRHSQFAFERQRFTRRRLVDLFTGAGLRVLRCSYANSLLLPVAAAKFRLWEPLLRRRPASGVELIPRWLDRLLYAALATEAAWLGRGRDLPAGQSLILIGERKG